MISIKHTCYIGISLKTSSFLIGGNCTTWPCNNFACYTVAWQWRIQDLVEGGASIDIDRGEALVRGTKCGGGGGRVREGGVPPAHLEENGNQEMLRGLLKHTKIRIL